MNAAVWEIPNRNGDLPTFPLEPDMRRKSSLVVNADEVLRKGLQQYLQFKDADLGTYLGYLINKRTQPFIDEYGQTIKNYKKVFKTMQSTSSTRISWTCVVLQGSYPISQQLAREKL